MDDGQLLRLLEETRSEVEKAEGKASILLAGGTLGVGTVTSVLLSGDVEFSDFGALTKFLFAATSVLMIGGLVLLGLSLVPRLNVNPADAPMLGYFGHVVRSGSLADFERLADGPADERARLTNQIWTLSVVTVRKYRYIAAAFYSFGIAIALGVLAYLAHVADL
jgi:hypothetical protein